MRIIQVEIPNDVSDEEMHSMFEQVWLLFEHPEVTVRVGTLYTSL